MTSENPNPQNDPYVPGQPYQPPAQNNPYVPGQPYQAPGQAYQPPAQPYQAPGQPYPYQAPGSYAPTPATGQLANWGTRALGGLVDYAAPSLVIYLLSMPFAPQVDGTTGTVTAAGPVYYLLQLLSLAWVIFNSGWKQGTTGQSFGKQIAKTRLVSEATGQPVGFPMAIVRQIAHFVDGVICGIGYLFPLWDAKKQTIADKIMHTVVVMDQPR